MDLDRYEGQLSAFLIIFILHLGHEEAKHSEACLFQGIILWENSGYAIAEQCFFLFFFSLLYSNKDVIPALQGEGSFQFHCQTDSMGTVGTEVNEMDIVFYGMACGVFRGSMEPTSTSQPPSAKVVAASFLSSLEWSSSISAM